jgi:hypothetical protein
MVLETASPFYQQSCQGAEILPIKPKKEGKKFGGIWPDLSIKSQKGTELFQGLVFRNLSRFPGETKI